ncbi:MAG: pitrilysin family protein [Bacteroidia bacterium]|nr:pitrilysin family protein [Bacteroidia bacterium]
MDRKIMPAIKTVTRLNLTHSENIRLSNGIDVVIMPAGTEPVCRVDLVFNAGSRYQDIIFQSSLTNQMIPEGTVNLTGGKIAEEFEFYGSYFNISADRDEADITIHSLEKHLEPVLRLMSEVLIHPTFPEEELNVIKANRIESMKVDDQRVESLARKQFNRLIFGENHPYGVVGEIMDMESATPAILADFHSRFYDQSHCRILITGPHPDQYLPLVERFFGENWPVNGNPKNAGTPELPPLQTNDRKRCIISRPDAVQTAIRIGKPLFSRLHPGFMGLTVVNTILGGYFGSRLMSNIREEKGYTYGIASHLPSLRDSGYFVIGSTVGVDVWEQTVSECFREIYRLCNDKVEPGELELVRNYLTGQVQRSVDGPFQIADQLRLLWIHDLDLNYLTDFMELINSITPEEIRNLAIKYLDPSNMVIVATGPIKSSD